MSEKRPATLETEAREDGALVLRGYAALYNVETTIAGMFREVIRPGAFDEAVGRDDVRALFNHNPDIVLGRTISQTLALVTDDRGLRYSVTLDPANPDHQRVHRMISRGDVSQSSFAFDVVGQEWAERESGTLPLRQITKTKLYDVSPVTYPAYAETTVTARDLPTAAEDAEAVLAADASVRVRLQMLDLKAKE